MVLPVYDIPAFREEAGAFSFTHIKTLESHVSELGYTCKPHRYTCYSMILVTGGMGKFTIDFATYEVRPLTVIFVTLGQVQSWKLSTNIEGFIVFLAPMFYNLYKDEWNVQAIPFLSSSTTESLLHLDPKRESLLLLLLQEIVIENNMDQTGRDEFIRSGLKIIFIRLARHYQRHAQPSLPPTTTKIRQLEFLVNKHFQSLRFPYQYAKLMNVTSNHLNILCRRVLKMSVGELIHRRLLLEAKRLLLLTDLPIKKVADDLGFSDKSHFIRFFRRRADTTPEQFRKSRLSVPRNPERVTAE